MVCVYGLCISRGIFLVFWLIAIYITFPTLLDYIYLIDLCDAIFRAVLFAGFFNLVFLVVQNLFFLKLGKITIDDIKMLDLRNHRVIVSISLICSLMFLYFSCPVNIFKCFIISWQEVSMLRNVWENIFLNLANVFLIIAGSALFRYLIFRTDKKLMLFFVFVVMCFILLLKAKFYILYLTVPMIMSISWSSDKCFVKLFYLIIVILLMVIMYYLSQYIRWYLYLNDWSFNKEFFFNTISNPVEWKLRTVFYKIVDYFSFNACLEGASYTRLSIKPLSLLVNIHVPDNPMYQYAEIMGDASYIIKASNHPSIYGDAYANFGFMGGILGVVWAVLLGALSNIYFFRSFLIYTSIQMVLCFTLPMAMRGSVFYSLYFILIVLASLSVIGYGLKVEFKWTKK